MTKTSKSLSKEHADAARKLIVGILKEDPGLKSDREDSPHGINISKAAKKIGVEQPTLSEFIDPENPKGGGLKLLVGFSDAYNVSLDALLGRPWRELNPLQIAVAYHEERFPEPIVRRAKEAAATGTVLTPKQWAKRMEDERIASDLDELPEPPAQPPPKVKATPIEGGLRVAIAGGKTAARAKEEKKKEKNKGEKRDGSGE